MGLNYSFEIFFPDSEVTTLLLELRALLTGPYPEDPRDDPHAKPARTLVLVDDRRVHLPCTAQWTAGITIALERNVKSPSLDLSLFFEREPVIEAYDDENSSSIGFLFDTDEPPQPRFLRVGYIYGQIWRGEAISRASFTAATTRMSRLFEESPSVQRTFVALARRCRAELVALDLEEGGEFEILDDPPGQRVTVETESFDEQGNYLGELDPAALLASLRAARAALNSAE